MANPRKAPDTVRRPREIKRPSRDARGFGRSVYPLLPYRRVDAESVEIDIDVIGSAFFVTSWGAFLTAKHLVADYVKDPVLAVLYFTGQESPQRFARCALGSLEPHPELDVAFGVAEIPLDLPDSPEPLSLSLVPLSKGEAVSVFGYSHTKPPDRKTRSGGLEFWPGDHHGHVKRCRKRGDPGFRGFREYVVTSETLGGASGAPLLRRSTHEACGVVSTGLLDALGYAVDVREFVDSWILDALGGLTIGEFSRKHPTVLRVRR